jgi:5'-nucleotidase
VFSYAVVKHRIVFLLVVAIALISCASAGAAEKKKKKPPQKPVRMQLLGINDFHGHLEAGTPGRISRTKHRRDGVFAGGAEYLAAHVRLLSRRRKHTLVVAAGDTVGGSPLLSSLFHDEPAIEAMNKIGLDIAAVGNHEFDEGANELRRLQNGGCHPVDGCADGTPFRGAKFPFLAANVISRRTGKPIFPPYVIRKVGGERIGFIGMTLEGTPEYISPVIAANLRFLDEAKTANRYVRQLRRAGVRAIVVLLHEGDFNSRRATVDSCPAVYGPLEDIVRRTSRDVDLFLTGHTHAAYDCVIDHRRVTSAGSYGRLITRIDLEISRRTHDIIRTATDNWIVGQDVMRAPDLTALLAHYNRFAAPLRDRVIGRLAGSASRTRDESGESRMGNLVADAQLSITGADAAFIVPGGVRAGLGVGNVTYGRAFMAQPFGTSLVSVTLTGAQILDLLKEQWCGQRSPQVMGPSATVSYSWSAATATAIMGKSCATAANPVSDLRLHGDPVNERRGYRVTVNSSMALGSGHLAVLAAATERTGGPEDIAALDEYLAPSVDGEPITPPALNRITRTP